MIDLETLGQGARSVPLEIGAVAFDPYGTLLDEMKEGTTSGVFYRGVDVDSAIRVGLEVDWSTISFWLAQDDDIRLRQCNAPRVNIGVAAEALRKFLQDNTVTHVWSHGAGFDCTIMEEVYRLLRKEVPWDFRKVRDTRTLFSVSDVTEEKLKWLLRRPLKHHPVHDAWAQARAVQYCLNGGDDDANPTQDPAGPRALAG